MKPHPDVYLAAPRVLILMYHSVANQMPEVFDWCVVDVERFRAQLAMVASRTTVIRLGDVRKYLDSGEQRPAVVITFDDGYLNNYTVAFPELHAANVPATIFATTALVGTSSSTWSGRLHAAISVTRAQAVEFAGETYPLEAPDQRVVSSASLQEALKRLPHPDLLRELAELECRLGVAPDRDILDESPFRMLGEREVGEMVTSGLVDIGAHGHNHAILSLLTAEDQSREVSDSVRTVHRITGKPCSTFAFPNGRFSDYSDETLSILSRSGIDVAVTAEHGVNRAGVDVLQLRRIGIGGDLSVGHFARIIDDFIEGGH